MNNGGGKMTSETQGNEGSSDENDWLATKWSACGAVRDHLVETGLAELVGYVVRCVEGDKCVDVLEANETLLKAEKELNGGIRGGRLVPHRSSEEAFTFWDLPIFKN